MEIEFYPNDFSTFISVALSTSASSITTVFYAKDINRFDGVEFAGDGPVRLKIKSRLHFTFYKAFVPLRVPFLPIAGKLYRDNS